MAQRAGGEVSPLSSPLDDPPQCAGHGRRCPLHTDPAENGLALLGMALGLLGRRQQVSSVQVVRPGRPWSRRCVQTQLRPGKAGPHAAAP